MSSSDPSANKRRSRILAIQKKNLVSLIENYFIRTIGRTAGVNFDDINIANWQRIALILNTLGPSKTAEQWKSSFYYMTNRIRKKVEIVRQCGARPSDNLSEIDFKIFEMSPLVDYTIDSVFANTDPNEYGKNSSNVPPECTVTSQENIEKIGDLEPENRDPEEQMSEDTELVDFAFSNSRHVVISHTSAYSGLEVTEENINFGSASEHIIVDSNDDVQGECHPIAIRSPIRGTPSSRTNHSSIGHEDRNRRAPSTESNIELGVQIDEVFENFPEGCDAHSFDPRIAKIRGQLSTDKQKIVSKSKKPVTEAKQQTSVRIPEIQKERLVQLIQNNFLKAVGQFAGSNGKFIKAQLWSKIAQELNTLGPPRTPLQWKATFNSIKASAKAKLADYHNEIDGTMTQPLTRLEEKIVSIYGMNCMDGHQSLGESGFQYDMTIPDARKIRKRTISMNRDSDEDAPINLGSDVDLTINLDNDTDLPTNLDDDIDVPTNLDDDIDAPTNLDSNANVPINLDIDDDSFQVSNDIITDDDEDRVLAEIIQEIWNEPENNGAEPMLSRDENNGQSTTSSARLPAHASLQTCPSAPSRARPAAPPQARSLVPSQARSSAPSQARSSAPSQARSSAPSQARSSAPSQARSSAPSQTRSSAPSQARSLVLSPARSLVPSQARSLVPSRVRSTGSAQAHSSAPSRARPLVPPRARASSPIVLTNVNQFFDDNEEDSDDSNFGRNSTANRSIRNVNQSSKPKRDRTDLSNTIPDAKKSRKRTMSITRESDEDVPISPDSDADVTINLDNDTDLPTNLDDDIDVPTNLNDDANVPINLDIDDDSFQASNDITDDYEERVLAEIIQEIRNEPENNGAEPMLNHVSRIAKKRCLDEINGQSTTSSARLPAHASLQTRPSAPTRAGPAAPPQARSFIPSQARSSAPSQARSSAPSQARSSAPSQARSSAPSQARSSAPPQARSLVPPQARSLVPSQARSSAPSQARSLASSQARSLVPSRVRSTGSAQAHSSAPSRARPLVPPRARPLVPPRARPRARASSPIELTNVNQFFDDNEEDSDDSNFGRNSTANRSIRNVNQSSKPKRDRTDLSNRITSFGMVQSSMSAQEQFIADANRNHSELMYLTDRNHLEMAGMFNSTINGFTEAVKEFLNRM